MTQRESGGRRAWLAAASLGAVLVFSPLASAQLAYAPQDQRVLAASAHERMQQLSQQLESCASRARDEAKIDERHGASDDVTERMDDFAKHAHQLRLLAFERAVPASKINDQIRQLVDRGRNVQKELDTSKRSSARTVADWDRTIATLNELNDQFMAANGLLVRPDNGVGTSGVVTDRDRIDRDRDYDRDDFTVADRDRYAAMDPAQLRAELNARTARAADLAVGADIDDVSSRIARFNDRLRDFNSSSPRMDRDERREWLDWLLRDAQATERELARRHVSTGLANQWNAVVDLLTRLRDRA